MELKGLSLSEAAKKAGVSFQRIDQLYRQGRIRSVDTPLGRLYREGDVEKYMIERQARAKKRAKKAKPRKAKGTAA